MLAITGFSLNLSSKPEKSGTDMKVKTYIWLRMVRFLLVLVSFSAFIACGGESDDAPEVSDTPEYRIEFVSNSESVLSVLGEGGVEISLVTFKVIDEQERAASNVLVNFELSSDVGSTSLTGGDAVVSDENGFVSTFLQSGYAPSAVRVIAFVDGAALRVRSDEIIVSTQRFSASYFSVGVVITDNTALGENGILVAGGAAPGAIVEFQVSLTEPNAAALLDGGVISFFSPETGAFSSASCVVQDGACTATWTSTEIKDPGYRASVIAYTHGSEAFEDENLNNLYDKGERFIDLGEPFVDENENGLFDAEEFYLDVNANGSHNDEGNGFWDGPCIAGKCEGASSTVIWDTLDLQLN